ncbi:MAG: glycosyltransferase family 2 protein [Paludibacteraceae bacterium]|nr:glycosyltransferase family 2 protein [Paludibacteraceae bacterium]
MGISVVINTYNAERYLEKVLQSVSGFDEIVVCDMESTDGTVEIAKRYDCKIITFEKGNHKSAEPARTYAIQSATNDWVLVVDADELVTPALRDYLYEQIKKPDCPSGLYIPRKNYMLGQWMKCLYPDQQLRFFKRAGTVWPPYVHTFPKVEGKVAKISKERHDLAFIHLPHDLSGVFRRLNSYSDNEVDKRKGTHVGYVQLLLHPAFQFFKFYILKGGIFQGKLGVIQAQRVAFYKYMVMAKIYESEMKEKDKEQEYNL